MQLDINPGGATVKLANSVTATATGLNSTVIGATTPAAGSFTTVSATSFGVIGARTQIKGTSADITGATGAGVEIIGGASTAGFLGYNRDSPAYISLNYNALSHVFQCSSATIANVSSTGLAVTGTLSTTRTAAGTNTFSVNGGTAYVGRGDAAILLTGVDSGGGFGISSTMAMVHNSAGNTSDAKWTLGVSATGGVGETVVITALSSGVAVTGTLSATGIVTPGAFTTGTRPTKTLGGIIFDTTLNKLCIGGASAWEVVTSV